jgi:hypothetical protein
VDDDDSDSSSIWETSSKEDNNTSDDVGQKEESRSHITTITTNRFNNNTLTGLEWMKHHTTQQFFSRTRPLVELEFSSEKKAPKPCSPTTTRYHCQLITMYTAALTRGNGTRACAAFIKMLTTNKFFLAAKSKLENVATPTGMTAEAEMIKSMAAFLRAHTTGGKRKKIHQDACDAVLTSVCWGHGTTSEGRASLLKKTKAALLGVDRNVIANTLQWTQKWRRNDLLFSPKVNKHHNNCMQHLARMCVDKRAHNERNSRVDPNSCVVNRFNHPVTGEEIEHAQRIWEVSTLDARLVEFLKSDANSDFKNVTGSDMGRTLFLKSQFPCIRKQRQQSCVDPIRSGQEHVKGKLPPSQIVACVQKKNAPI